MYPSDVNLRSYVSARITNKFRTVETLKVHDPRTPTPIRSREKRFVIITGNMEIVVTEVAGTTTQYLLRFITYVDSEVETC